MFPDASKVNNNTNLGCIRGWLIDQGDPRLEQTCPSADVKHMQRSVTCSAMTAHVCFHLCEQNNLYDLAKESNVKFLFETFSVIDIKTTENHRHLILYVCTENIQIVQPIDICSTTVFRI